MQKEIISKKIFTDRIRSHIANNKWENLIKLFPGAEEEIVKEFETELKLVYEKLEEKFNSL